MLWRSPAPTASTVLARSANKWRRLQIGGRAEIPGPGIHPRPAAANRIDLECSGGHPHRRPARYWRDRQTNGAGFRSEDEQKFRGQGFTRVQPLQTGLIWNALEVTRTAGQHGTGEIGKKMAPV